MIVTIPSFLLFFFANANESVSKIYYSSKLNDSQKSEQITEKFNSLDNAILQVEFSNALIDIAKRENDILWLIRGYNYKGNAYLLMSEPDKAYEYYLKSLANAQSISGYKGFDLIYVGLGNAFVMNNNPNKAIKYFKSALLYLRKNEDIIYEGYTILNIVNEYNTLQIKDSAYHYLILADSIFLNSNDLFGKAYVDGQKAIYYASIEELIYAEEYLSSCIKQLKEIGQTYDITAFQIEMAKILQRQKKFESALKYAHYCYKKSKSASLNGQIRDASKLLSEIYNELGDHKKAYNFHVEYVNYNDSISNEETIRKMADLRADYEISQKQAEIDTLEKRHSFNRVIISIVATSLLILIILSYRLYINHKLVKKQKSKLQKLDKTKNKMFSIISHDLRGPIHSMTGYSSLMSELIINRETDELMEISGLMKQSFVNISALLDNLLEWATNQQGNIPHSPELLNVFSIFNSLRETFSNSAKVKDVSINLQIDKNLKLYVDKNTFSTIFRNLIGNAIKFTNKGDTITLSSKITDKNAVLSVTDTGIGISKEKLPDLFVLGKTKSTWGTANEKGIGLGLRLVHEFTVLNNGKISVESEEGKGSVFSIEFPLPKNKETGG